MRYNTRDFTKVLQQGKWLFDPESKFRVRWDLWVILLAIFNWFQVPYNVAFGDEKSEEFYSITFDAIINLFFILDILISFMTMYVDSDTKEVVVNRIEIAKHYIRGRFVIDLLASIPFDYFIYVNTDSQTFLFNLLSLLKLIRILRLSKLITYLNLRNEIKSSLRLVKLVFFLILYLHCLGWGWFFITKQNEEWIPPLDYVYITTNLYSQSTFFKYCMSLYHAVLMLGGNDVGPRGELQLIFIAIVLVTCAIWNAIIFGNFAVMLQSLNRKSSLFQEKLETITDVMKNMSLNNDVKDEIKFYIEYTENTLQNQNEMNEFFKILSPSLKKRVMVNMFQEAIMENVIFEHQESIVSRLWEKLTIKVWVPEEKIIVQGDIAQSKLNSIYKL